MMLEKNSLVWAKMRPDAVLPTRCDEDAGYDVYPCIDKDYIRIPAHETQLIPTGIAVAMSDDYYIHVEERGSTGSKGIKKSAGIIDSGYRGEIFIAITNANNKELIISKLRPRELYERGYDINCDEAVIYPHGKAIAQLIVQRVHKMNESVVPYEELLRIPSTRGTGALGSSNK